MNPHEQYIEALQILAESTDLAVAEARRLGFRLDCVTEAARLLRGALRGAYHSLETGQVNLEEAG